MLIDKNCEFSDAQAETTVADHASTNVLDIGSARNIGPGADLYCVARVQTTCTSLGAATVEAKLVESDSADLSSPTTLLTSGAVALADLVAGKTLLNAKVPFTSKRYIGMIYTIGTAALTAGKFDAFLTPTSDAQANYPSGFSVL